MSIKANQPTFTSRQMSDALSLIAERDVELLDLFGTMRWSVEDVFSALEALGISRAEALGRMHDLTRSLRAERPVGGSS